MVEVVQAHEEQGLAPVERPEHPVLDRALEVGDGVGGQHPLEEGLALLARGGADHSAAERTGAS